MECKFNKSRNKDEEVVRNDGQRDTKEWELPISWTIINSWINVMERSKKTWIIG